MLFVIVGMLQLAAMIGVILRASGAMITAVFEGTISLAIAIIAMTVLFVIYGVAGGLFAAIVTDFIQGIVTILLSFLILPFALNAVGGLKGLREIVNDPSIFGIVALDEITTFYVIIISLNALIGWVTQPNNMALCAAGKTELESRIGLVGGMFLKRICTIGWVLIGLCGIGLYAGKTIHVDYVYDLLIY